MSIIDDEEMKTCFCYEDNNCYFKQLQRLKAENEELKEKNKFLDSMTGIFSARQAKKYHQALEEVREIINFRFRTAYMSFGFKDYDKLIEDIEKIINEVLNEVLK